ADGKATTISYALADGTNGLAANYSMATFATTGDINPRALTAASTVADKTYDGLKTTGTVSLGTVSTLVSGEDLAITPSASDFADANAADGKATTISYALADGTNGLAANYSMATFATTGDINPRALTAASTVADKTYDGLKTTGTVSLGTVSTLVSGEDLAITPSASNFGNANAADGKATTISYSLANGTTGLAANYSMATFATTGDINPATLTVTATGPAKAYGIVLTAGASTTNFMAAITAGSELVTSVTLTPDAAGLSSLTLPEADYVVTPSLATGTGGFLASNYNITYTAYNGTVSKKVLTVTAAAKSKTYDGSVFTPFTSTITGFVNNEIATDVVTGTVTYTGNATTAVNSGSYVITPVVVGLSATNYTFVSVNGSLNIWDLEITDTTPPSWVTASNSLDRTVEYGDAVGLSAAQLLSPAAVDANSFLRTKISGELVKTQDCNFGGTYTNTWTAKDSYGNISIVFKQVITIVKTFNDQPKIDQVQDFSVYKNSKQVEVSLSGIDPASNCTPQEIASLIASADNSLLITEILVNYTKGNSTGKLVLKIADNLLGESLIRVTLQDNGGVANGAIDTQEMTFKVKIVGEDQGPKLTSQIPILIINPGNSFEVNLNNYFSNQNNNPVTYTATLANGTTLPSWMVFNPLTGTISGVAPQNDLGSYQIFVTATDSQGLTSQTSFWLVNTTAGTSVVSGNISSTAGSVTDGIQVILLKIGDNNQTTIIEKRDLNGSSSFTFGGLPSGTYLLNAVVTDVVKHPDLLNTYYNGSSSVFNAQRIEIGSQNNTGIQLQMLQKTPVSSSGSISGLVTRKVGPATPGNDQIGQLAPDVDVVLKQDGKIVANTLTNMEGKYSFNLLPEGNYVVEVEQLGFILDIIKNVTIAANSQNAVDVNFTIWTTGTITKVNDLFTTLDIKMYPNPTSGQLNIASSKDGYATVSVFNASGKEVFRQNYLSGEAINIDLSSYVSGFYFVKFESEGEFMTRKIILKK
ncbi:T9SS type A sorting domain-containing protein, partial [bacterium]|nr:T9SS type A sorting domain-containing protein [bacterium]